MRPTIAYSYSHGSTISRSSSSGSSDSEAAAKRAHDFKLPKLKRKPVPVYADEDGKLCIPLVSVDDNNEISVILLDEKDIRLPSSASDFASDQSSPKDDDSCGTFSQDGCSRRTSVSSVPSAISMKERSFSESSQTSIDDDKKIPTHPSMMARRTSFTKSETSIDCIVVLPQSKVSFTTMTPLSPSKSPMSKRKPVPYMSLTEEQPPASTSDSFVCGNMLGLSGESRKDEIVEQNTGEELESSKKVAPKRKSKHTKKSILASAASAKEGQAQRKSLAPPRPSRRDAALKSGEISPVLSECSFHTAGTDDEDDQDEDDNNIAEQPTPLPGCLPSHHTARVFVSKNKRGKTKYYVVPPRRVDASLQG